MVWVLEKNSNVLKTLSSKCKIKRNSNSRPQISSSILNQIYCELARRKNFTLKLSDKPKQTFYHFDSHNHVFLVVIYSLCHSSSNFTKSSPANHLHKHEFLSGLFPVLFGRVGKYRRNHYVFLADHFVRGTNWIRSSSCVCVYVCVHVILRQWVMYRESTTHQDLVCSSFIAWEEVWGEGEGWGRRILARRNNT